MEVQFLLVVFLWCFYMKTEMGFKVELMNWSVLQKPVTMLWVDLNLQTFISKCAMGTVLTLLTDKTEVAECYYVLF